MSIFVIITSLTFVSCESDSSTVDSNNNNNSGGNTSNVLLTKVIETNSNNEAITAEFFYNGNKLNYVTDNGNNKSVFIYTDNLITAINSYTDNVLETKDEYVYDANSRLIEHKQYDYTDTGDVNHLYKFTFVYNSNNTINYELYSIVPSAGFNSLESSGIINLDANQNIISNTDTDAISNEVTSYTYTFDDKNNPYKNIVGFEKIRYSWPSDEIDGSILNNVLNVNINSSSNSITTYTYNALNFPITSTFSGNGETYNTQYFYN